MGARPQSRNFCLVPYGLSDSAIKQYITDLYNSGEMLIDLNIAQVEFESISARIVQEQADTNSISLSEVTL
ncbi:hypothetical protein LC653_24040 [Nostoc sp. CHAB 5784]|uniref:hypothetical protein n=1 Tax=Nostoc mirabile TaxID=2907820 RepID=UPI001E5F5915|nr:hypothetical protein [Nostoc mirabile]MCC5666879.1 hypothetical protein [Nostoc mirabile CHAB5784]